MRPVRRADNLTTFMCRLSSDLGALTSWNPKGLSRFVMGLLYLYLTLKFLVAKEFARKLSAIWTRVLKIVRQPCTRPKKFKEYRF
jgi:hypothetical protein